MEQLVCCVLWLCDWKKAPERNPKNLASHFFDTNSSLVTNCNRTGTNVNERDRVTATSSAICTVCTRECEIRRHVQ